MRILILCSMFDVGRSTFNVKDASGFLPGEFSRLTDSNQLRCASAISVICRVV
jgi:hypothetical protein